MKRKGKKKPRQQGQQGQQTLKHVKTRTSGTIQNARNRAD